MPERSAPSIQFPREHEGDHEHQLFWRLGVSVVNQSSGPLFVRDNSLSQANPVVFAIDPPEEPYFVIESTLPKYRYSNWIVGFTEDQVYAVTNRKPRSGYYEMLARPFPWRDADVVRLERFLSLGSIGIGLFSIIIGVGAWYVWWQGVNVPRVLLWLWGSFPLVGLTFILGSNRLRLTVTLPDRTLQWIAPPLSKVEKELRDALSKVPGMRIDSLD